MEPTASRPERRASWVAGAVLLMGCAGAPPPAPAEWVVAERPTAEAWEQRLRLAAAQLDAGDPEAALAATDAALADLPPEVFRRRFAQLAVESRRARFYDRHPLHLALALDRERYSFGDTATVTLRIANLGNEGLDLPARFRSFTDHLTFGEGERSVMFLKMVREDADGTGARWSGQELIDVPVEHDLELGPGGVERIEVRVPVGPPAGARSRRLWIAAVYRPIAICAQGGERRYDRLQFPVASARVLPERSPLAPAGSLVALDECLAGDALIRPEALFDAALALGPAEIGAGLELLARAAPALDPVRRRAALAALQELTGEDLGADPVRWLDWWQTRGRRMTDAERLRRSGLAGHDEGGELFLGSDAPDEPGP